MSKIIRKFDNQNQPIVDSSSEVLPEIYFNLLHCEPGKSVEITVPGTEIVAVVMSGKCDIAAGDAVFADIGQRSSIWDGKADSVYAGVGRKIVVTAKGGPVEVALAGAATEKDHAPFRVSPDEVSDVVVGSSETKTKRTIFHILGQNANNRVSSLLVSELYCEEGCWSGYPPHKHDEDRDGETNHAELYHYRYDQPAGFGAQFYYKDGVATAEMVRNGDTFLVPDGYHPTCASPGHNGYVFTVLVGRTKRGLMQYFDEDHTHMMDKIPGISAMRAQFK